MEENSKVHNENIDIWLGMASLEPSPHAEERHGDVTGGLGLVACRSKDIVDAVRLIRDELDENGWLLVGFDWLTRLIDYDEELTEYAQTLIDRLSVYPVQFENIHTYSQRFDH